MVAKVAVDAPWSKRGSCPLGCRRSRTPSAIPDENNGIKNVLLHPQKLSSFTQQHNSRTSPLVTPSSSHEPDSSVSVKSFANKVLAKPSSIRGRLSCRIPSPHVNDQQHDNNVVNMLQSSSNCSLWQSGPAAGSHRAGGDLTVAPVGLVPGNGSSASSFFRSRRSTINTTTSF